ncbi:hypothetical protein GYMLUDRAFT_373199 [Collybiopsis luxurians FD-317 M1]|uniref:Zn(2)-C6 fungal-type domain-containing protein n=1 Tax=Collybiopsis luxurians FD-317 M1 TaxID=944289 RepID=A0A0D0APA0_9AGAR|nr:hypothetical protein GYMLUDRAFT_373199 [Collybiopsis luxurians FD-317 M1]
MESSQRSALPTSLIPHLYSAPQTSRDRTTLPQSGEEDNSSPIQDNPRSASPFLLRPIPSPPPSTRRYPSYDSTQEMRLPSAAVPSIRGDPAFYPPRQSYNYPNMDIHQPYINTAPPSTWREDEPSHRDFYTESRERLPQREAPDSYRYSDHYPQHQPRHNFARDIEHYQDYAAYSQVHGMDSILRAPRSVPEGVYSAGQQDMYIVSSHLAHQSSPQSALARGWGPPPSSASDGSDYATSAYPSLPPVHESRYSPEPDDDGDGEYLPPGHRSSQKRKLESSEQQGPSNRPKGAKKTLIACDFCRGRKLRCDGTRPSCWNCRSRENQSCVYQSHPRRRGPGKAPKGQRRKKAADASVSDPEQRSRLSERYGDDFDMGPGMGQQLPSISFPPSLPQAGLILPLPRMAEAELPLDMELPHSQDENGSSQQQQQGYLKGPPRDKSI